MFPESASAYSINVINSVLYKYKRGCRDGNLVFQIPTSTVEESSSDFSSHVTTSDMCRYLLRNLGISTAAKEHLETAHPARSAVSCQA